MARRSDRADITRTDLQQAFWKLYSEKPVGAITVGAVCEVAGYNRATFYLHYHDLYELLETIEEAQLDGMAGCVESSLKALADDAGRLARVGALKDVVAYYEGNKDKIDILLGKQSDPRFLLRLKNRLKPLWRTYVVRNPGDHSEEEVDLILEYTLTGTLFMVSCWLQHPDGVSKMRIGHLVYDAAIRDVALRIQS